MLIDEVGVSLLVRWLLGWLLCLRMPVLPAGTRKGTATVSVLIPARNEATTLPHLLAALKRQTFQPLEVIVIDDHSSDATGSLARATGVTVVEPPPLPPHWCGKTWALHQGVGASRGELLVFLDADTEPQPAFLESLVAAWEEVGGLVSVQPYHNCRCCSTWWV